MILHNAYSRGSLGGFEHLTLWRKCRCLWKNTRLSMLTHVRSKQQPKKHTTFVYLVSVIDKMSSRYLGDTGKFDATQKLSILILNVLSRMKRLMRMLGHFVWIFDTINYFIRFIHSTAHMSNVNLFTKYDYILQKKKKTTEKQKNNYYNNTLRLCHRSYFVGFFTLLCFKHCATCFYYIVYLMFWR